MKFNTIIICLVLWGTVCFIAIISGFFKSIRAKKLYSIQMKYLRQFIFLAGRGVNSGNIIRELHCTFIRERRLRKTLIRAMRMPSSQGLELIYQAIGCEPMNVIHKFVLERERRRGKNQLCEIPEDIIKYFNNLVEEWDEKVIHNRKVQNRSNIKAFLEVIVFILLDLVLYSYVQTDLSLMIFAIANTVGVIMFIILTNEGYVVDKKNRDRKLARVNGQEKKTRPVKWIHNLYQLVGGLGLIINIFIIVSEWLGPVA